MLSANWRDGNLDIGGGRNLIFLVTCILSTNFGKDSLQKTVKITVQVQNVIRDHS